MYFADENLLGLGKLLRDQGRDDVFFPGHPALAEVPLGTTDIAWMRVVTRRNLVVLTRDRRIRSRPADLRAYVELGIRSVWIGGKQGLGPRDQCELFHRFEARLEREIIKHGSGPWVLSLTPSGVRPLRMPGLV